MKLLPLSLSLFLSLSLSLAACGGGTTPGDLDATTADVADAGDPGGPDDLSRAGARSEVEAAEPDDGTGQDDGADLPGEAGADGEAGPDADVPEDAVDATEVVPVDAADDTGTELPWDDGPGDPGAADQGLADPGTGDPGTTDSGPGDPGWTDPGVVDPGVVDPGPTDPGPTDPGATDPGVTDSGYTGIYAGMEGLAGQALVDRLCPLVRDGYVKIAYDKTDELMRDDIDQYGGNVREVYTGRWVSNWTGLNKEHTWPQGYFDEGGPEDPDMKSDLFNLFPSDIDYNNRRSSYPFGVVVSRLWPLEGDDLGDPACAEDWPGPGTGCFSLLGTDAAGEKVFEPRDGHKGNAARAVFYFALRYGTADCKVRPLTAFDPYGAGHAAATEALLKEWSRRDPPDLHERNRNDRIEAYQKVRNPFVDHPEFLERIGFL